ncbi:RDD family protein [Halococcus hamelinensis]|uniref:Membrane protein n=1 Tax=Halococcus hamelinensis 100A6 TaxID=1132509 RepID=M0LWI7_9EURY|nr:RDD family protein [Halococcus hamelinensis]EMA36729.1 membrane protein [Halococcus hamelinensis 100A6]
MRRRLDLFGTIHFDRLSKVEDELRDYVQEADADAVFVEWPTDSITRRMAVRAAIRVPLVLLGGVVLNVIRSPYYLLFNRRFDSTEHVATERLSPETPVHRVDRSLVSVMAESGPLAIALSWFVLIAFLVVAPIQTAVTVGVLLAVGVGFRLVFRRDRRLAAVVGTLVAVTGILATAWFDIEATAGLLLLIAIPLAGGIVISLDPGKILRGSARLALVPVLGWLVLSTDLVVGWFALAAYTAVGQFALRTVDVRNEHMLDRVTTIADEEGYDTVVLVTGLAHVSGLGERATGRDLRVSRTYTPRWLRTGTIDEEPSFEPDEGRERVSRDHPIQPGSTGRRATASLLDLAAVAVLTWALSRGLDIIPGLRNETGFVAAGFVLIAFGYHLGLEATFGRTLGKRLTRLVVTDEDGDEPSRRAYLIRNLVRPVDFVALYFVGFVTMALTKRRQRLGDLLAGTEVRKVD